MGLPWTDEVTDLVAANMNRAVHTSQNTQGIRVAAASFVPQVGPSLSNLDGFASVVRNGAGDYTLSFSTAFVSAPRVFADTQSSQATILSLTATTTTLRVIIYRWDAGTQTMVTNEAIGTVTAVHVMALGIQ